MVKNKEGVSIALMVGLIALSFMGGAMAIPRGNNAGFDSYGYNEKAELFQGCLANYYNWKSASEPTECSTNDLQVHANWHFSRDGGLDWLLNLFYSPVSGDHVLKKYVTIDKEECDAAGGVFFNLHKVTQTGEIVPVCQIQEIVSGEGVSILATPAGFGVYGE